MDRFLEKVDKSGSCWVWTGYRVQFGYGIITTAKRRERAHRVSYRLHVGPIPDGLLVLHKCDNPPCVNPDHLFLGTDLDNKEDCKRKGRLGIRYGQSLKTHCKNGHALSDEHRRSTGHRYCRICGEARSLARQGRHGTFEEIARKLLSGVKIHKFRQ